MLSNTLELGQITVASENLEPEPELGHEAEECRPRVASCNRHQINIERKGRRTVVILCK